MFFRAKTLHSNLMRLTVSIFRFAPPTQWRLLCKFLNLYLRVWLKRKRISLENRISRISRTKNRSPDLVQVHLLTRRLQIGWEWTSLKNSSKHRWPSAMVTGLTLTSGQTIKVLLAIKMIKSLLRILSGCEALKSIEMIWNCFIKKLSHQISFKALLDHVTSYPAYQL